MRITGGHACGRRISTLKGGDIRPTSDKVREALFQILTVRFEGEWHGKNVLDMFAGSGTLGIEALSRGADSAVFADNSPRALGCIKSNLKALGLADRAVTLRADFRKPASAWTRLEAQAPFSLVLADPPYKRGFDRAVLKFVSDYPLLAPDGVLVLEEFAGIKVPNHIAGESMSLKLDDTRRYGQTAVFFFVP